MELIIYILTSLGLISTGNSVTLNDAVGIFNEHISYINANVDHSTLEGITGWDDTEGITGWDDTE